MRWPGIEPGSTAWKAAMLAFTPPTLSLFTYRRFYFIDEKTRDKRFPVRYCLKSIVNYAINFQIFSFCGHLRIKLFSKLQQIIQQTVYKSPRRNTLAKFVLKN